MSTEQKAHQHSQANLECERLTWPRQGFSRTPTGEMSKNVDMLMYRDTDRDLYRDACCIFTSPKNVVYPFHFTKAVVFLYLLLLVRYKKALL